MKQFHFRHRTCRRGAQHVVAVLSCLSLAMTAPAFAQEDPIDDEIIVYAQKREQRLKDVPMTVTVVTDEKLRASGTSDIAELQTIVPGMNYVTTIQPALSQLKLRGAGTGGTDPTVEPSVGLFIDGVYMPRTVFGLTELVDVDRVEILFGPQGTLYGKNTNSGVVSLHTKKPTRQLEGFAEITGGNYDLLDFQAAVSGPLSDTVSVRLSGRGTWRDGYLKDENSSADYNDADNQAVRGQLLWEPNQETSVRFIGYHSEKSGMNLASDSFAARDGSSRLGDLYDIMNFASGGGLAPIGTDPNDRKVSYGDRVPEADLTVSGGSVEANYATEGVIFTSITGYQRWLQHNHFEDSDQSPFDIFSTSSRWRENSFSQELRVASPGGDKVDWMAGVYYFKSDLENQEPADGLGFGQIGADAPLVWAGAPIVDTGDVFPMDLDFDQIPDVFVPIMTPFSPSVLNVGDTAHWTIDARTKSFALFVQGTVSVTDDLSLSGGLRYSHEKKDMIIDSFAENSLPDAALPLFLDMNFDGVGETPFATIPGAVDIGGLIATLFPTIHEDLSRTDNSITGMASVNYQATDDVTLYASFSTGEKSGGFNPAFGNVSADAREFDEEKTWNLEGGFRSRVAGGRARLNLAYFFTRYRDFQDAVFDPVSTAFLVQNAGRQTTQGVDLSITANVTDSLTLSADIEYLHAKFNAYENAACHSLADAVHVGGPGSPICDFSGERLPFAPRWAGSFAADYVFPLDWSEIYLHGDFSFKSNYTASSIKAPEAEGVSYELLNARIGWRSDKWDVAAWVKNLTNQTYGTIYGPNVISNFLTDPADPDLASFRVWLNNPRTYGLTLRREI